MITYDKSRPYLKRIAIKSDAFEGIQRYDSDNLYPQKALEIRDRSYTLKSVIERVGDFINGEGFENPTVANLKVNNNGLTGQTMNDVLMAITPDYASFKSFALHINYDFNFKICEITPLEFALCRMAIPVNGQVLKIKYSADWSRDSKVEEYNVFDPRPDQVEREIKDAGGIDRYKGQIFYFTPKHDRYPLATFDPVLDHAQAQSELGIGKVSNVQNQFLSTLAIVYPGQFESEQEKQDFRELIANKSGSRNSGTRIGIQDPTGTKKAGDIFQPLTPPNIDRLFEYTEKSIVDAIMENEAMPKEILGVRPDSGMFNQQNMQDAYIYFNSITRSRRTLLSRQISNLLFYWQQSISDPCNIIPQKYLDLVETNKTQPDQQVVNDNLKNLTGRQLQGIQRVVRKYNRGELSFEQATQLLKNGFGFTDQDVNDWLVTPEEAAQP